MPGCRAGAVPPRRAGAQASAYQGRRDQRPAVVRSEETPCRRAGVSPRVDPSGVLVVLTDDFSASDRAAAPTGTSRYQVEKMPSTTTVPAATAATMRIRPVRIRSAEP